MKYFVYIHTRNDTGDVFYVGKGTTRRDRMERHMATRRRSAWWRRIAAKHGFSARIVGIANDEGEAFYIEKTLIHCIGRRDLGLGPLVNLTDGGEGHSGLIVSPELRRRRSDAVRGDRHPNWGKRLSAATCIKKSESVRGNKHHLYGKRLPQEWRDKIAAAKVGSNNPQYGKVTPIAKRVICDINGEVYPSISRAAIALGVNPKTMLNAVANNKPNRWGIRKI